MTHKYTALILICFAFIFGNQVNAEFSPLGSGPALINRENLNILENYDLEKNKIQTTESDLEKRQKEKEELEKEEQENIKGNITYNPKFTLNEVIFEGNTVISDKKLQNLASNIVGKDIYLEDIMKLTLDVSKYYQKKGYLTSFAYLDEQEIVDGVVTIKIKESRVAQKEVTGNKWERDRYLTNFILGGHGLNKNNVFNARDLQGAMKNLNKEDYVSGSVAISRDENKDTVIKMHVEDRFPIKLEMGWDDFGRDYTGRQRFTTIAGMHNLTGFGDKIYGGAILSQDSRSGLAGYEIPIGRWGTKLGVGYSHSRMDLGGPYRKYGIFGQSNDYMVKLTQPIINNATQQLDFTVGFDWLDSKSDSKYFYNLSDYTLRVLRTKLDGVFDDKWGRSVVNIGTDIGFDGMGASKGIDNGAQSAFYKVYAGLARVQRLPKECLAIARVNGQYSSQSLFPVEQMYIGGAYSLRGYQPSELIGDYGVAGSFEVRTPVPGIKSIFPKKYEDDWAKKVRLVFFYDWGYVKEHNNLYNYPTNFLHSVGFGSNINITDALSLQIGLGIPLSNKLNENKARIYFTLNSKLDKMFLKPKNRDTL